MVRYEALDMGPLPAESERRSKHVQSRWRFRSFRSKAMTLVVVSGLIFLTTSGKLRIPSSIHFPRPHSPPSFSTQWQSLSDAWQMPFGASDSHSEGSSSFHILIPISKASSSLCKTAFSAMVLGYPAPALLNSPRKHARLELATNAKTQGVHDFLRSGKGLKDSDLVLVLNSHDAWFQLPPEILINRFFELTKTNNERLRGQYGTKVVSNITEPTFSQKVLSGAGKLCEPSSVDSLACEAVPYAPLPEDPWPPINDENSADYQKRRRWLNAGTVMGRVSDMRKLYARVVEKAPTNRDGVGEQQAFAKIFGEQEYMREITRQSKTNSWLDWLSSKMGSQLSAPNITNLHFESKEGINYEFGVGLDYRSELLFTAMHSQRDLYRLSFSDGVAVAKYDHDGVVHTKTIYLPLDIQRLSSPLESSSGYEDGNLLPSSKSSYQSGAPDPASLSFSNLPLAVDTYSAAIPPLLHSSSDSSFNSDSGSTKVKSELPEDLWRSMWYHPYAKVLLNGILRAPPSTPMSVTVKSGPRGAEETFSWDRPGGKNVGGAFRGEEQWTELEGVCEKNKNEDLAM